MSLRFYDAHNHLQDDRLKPHLPNVMAEIERAPIAKMVVNGACEGDWADVLALAKKYKQVVPSFGYHPWYIQERTPNWQKKLAHYLDSAPSAIGEIGLDKWIENHDIAQQQDVFIYQLRLAAERNLPVSIHCLQAWGRLFDILRTEPRPSCGFVLHSYGGPQEMIPSLAKVGAYFSFPGYFAHERKLRQRQTFRRVPPDRLLIETDAPDQLLPDGLNRHPLRDGNDDKPLNHPVNIQAVYEYVAEVFGVPVEKLATRVEENFLRLFGGVLRKPSGSAFR